MSLKAYNIDVPITPGVMPPVIHIGQYDSGRDYICHLKNDDGTDYTIPSGTTATFTGCNPRKEVFELEATVDTGANTVTITPKDEATSMFGKYGATLNLELYGDKMSPIVILMDVQKAGATDEEIAGAANFPDAVTEAVNDWLEENIDEGQLGDLYVPRAPQAAKTAEMTQPVGMDNDGKLWTTPGGGGGTITGAVRYDTTQSLTSTQKSTARSNIGAGTGTYSKPSSGIPKTDLASAVQTSLGKADTALQSVSAENVLDAAEDFTASQQALVRGYIGAAAATDVSAIAAKIPSEASASNPLADKAWVLSQGGGGGGGTVEGAVRYDTAQSINAIQQATARNNIDAEQAGAADAVQTDLNAVKAKIPAAASASNQLADKAWVLQQGGGGGGGTAPQTIIAVVDASSSPYTVTLTDISDNGLSYSAVESMVQAGPVTLVVYNDQYHFAGFNWHFSTFDGAPYPSTKGLTLFAIVPDSPNPSLYIARLEEDGNGILTGPMTYQPIGAGDAIKETTTTRTAAQMGSGFKVYGNTIYSVTGSVSGFAISNGADEKPDDLVEIRLTVGSTAITVPTWPSWATFLNGFDGNLAANTIYDIFINDAGYIWCGTSEVSA